jgi:hypothetical protein
MLSLCYATICMLRYHMFCPPSKPLRTAPYKQQVHWLFYVPAYAYAYVCIMQYAL